MYATIKLVNSRKDHGKKGCRRKLGLLVLFPQLDVTKLDRDKEDKHKENPLGTDKQPGKVKSHAGSPVDEGLV
jgi:hypothetical protein